MKLIWTDEALRNIDAIYHYIWADSRLAARRVRTKIIEEPQRLLVFPHSGRIGIEPGTREITFAPWPYILTYEVADGFVVILNVRHGAQRWPPQPDEPPSSTP